MSGLEFKVLGPLEVRRDGSTLALAGGKPRAVLAVLLLHANEPVSAERLAGALWGEDAPAKATRTVLVHVSRLRRALGDDELVTTSRAGYRLRVRPGELDLEQFERLVEDGRRALAEARAEQAGALLREALALWRGPALADVAFEPFAVAEIARLEEERVAAVEARVEADLAAGRGAELVPELQRLVGEHPLRERLHGQLMLALYRAGRQSEALEAYRRAREMLVEQLGIEPGEELRELEQAILAHSPGLSVPVAGMVGADEPVGPSGPETGGRVRIPVAPTPTVGRDAALERLRGVVGDPAARLVTLVGPPGVGKTRLAIEAAWAIAPQLRDGAIFVSLAAVDRSEHVGSTIAREIAVRPIPGESVNLGLARHLARRKLLLVLDNFEHVLDAAALVAELLAAAPEVTVLATSREPLRLRAERLVRVEPLALPQSDGERSIERPGPAVELFVAAARARDPGFRLGDDNWSAVLETCRRLDGLPLAIELAAGRIGLLSVSELAARLRTGMDVLGPAPRDAPSRQRTLTATLEWSYALLDSIEQRALRGLAAFAGGCSLDAAQFVAGAPLEIFEALVARNLVFAQPRTEGPARLGMLETVRAFARTRLARSPEASDTLRRHCEYYLALAEKARPTLDRSGSPALLAELDAELDNSRGALRWSSENAPVLALRLATALEPYWNLRALKPESAGWLEAALTRDVEAVPASVRAAALATLGFSLAEPGGASERAEAAVRESLELRRAEGDRGGCARSTNLLAVVHRHANRTDDAYHCAREAERLALEAGDDQAVVWARAELAMSAPTLEEALTRGEQVAAAHRAAGHERELSGMQSSLAYVALGYGDHATAERLALDALEAARALDDPYLLALAFGSVGLTALFSEHPDRAVPAFVEELRLMGRRGYGTFVFEALNGLAAVAAAQSRDRVAATLSGAADATITFRHEPAIASYLEERYFSPARARLGETAWQAAYAGGADLDRDQAIDAALQGVRLRIAA